LLHRFREGQGLLAQTRELLLLLGDVRYEFDEDTFSASSSVDFLKALGRSGTLPPLPSSLSA